MPTTALIDWPRVRRVLDEYPALDGYEAYYRQHDVPQRRIAPLVPQVRDVLAAALGPAARVLDIGCGRADTLIALSAQVGRGVGIDESAVMLAQARDARAAGHVDNL